MTVKELVAALNDLQAPEDYEVRVFAFGGTRAGKSVEYITLGFDWDMNSVVIHPKQPLTLCANSKRRKKVGKK